MTSDKSPAIPDRLSAIIPQEARYEPDPASLCEQDLMKLPPFEYQTPITLDEAIALLAADPRAKLIAGGQSLMPILAFRLVAPSMLVDLRRIPGLGDITIADTGIRIGARVRWRDIELDARLCTAHPLLLAAIAHVANYPVRNRGTVGGSLAYADPAAELPGVAVTCDAKINVVGTAGARTIRATEFFRGPLMTALRADEIVTELHLPAWPKDRRWSFQEFARRHGDFALAGVALHYDVDKRGRFCDMRIGVIGACSLPHRLPRVEAMLNGQRCDEQTIQAAAQEAASSVDPPAHLHASATYRRALVVTLVERALRAAEERSA